MKVTFSRPALVTGIGLTQNAVSMSGALPILANVLIEADAKGVNLIGTDLEIFAKVSLEAKVEEAGRITAPARTIGDIVRRLPDDDVAVVTSATRLTLTCNRNVYHLATMSAEDFPEWPKVETAVKITLRQADLKRLLRSTLFAIPARDPRRVLMGALFELSKGKMICVATDGRKLGKAIAEPVQVVGKKKEIKGIIPRRMLEEVDKAIGEEGEIELAITERQAIFTLPNVVYLTSLIEGNFPKYESVIPETFKKTLELPKAALDDAVDRAGVLAERKYNSIILSFVKNAIEVRAQSFDDGSYEGQVEINYDGEPFKIAFSHQYLREVFRVISDSTVRMKMKDNNAPVVFESPNDADSLYLVMPIRMHDLENEDEESEEEESEEAREEAETE